MSATGIVTPEAVRLEFEGASAGSRVLAAVIDLIVLVTLLIVGFVTFAAVYDGGLADALVAALGIIWTFVCFFVIPVTLETLWRGRTLGKAALGLRVVTKEGAPVRLRHAVIRAAFALLELYATVGSVAIISVLASRRQQRLGDLVAGTLVLRERQPRRAVEAVDFSLPPEALEYARTVDVTSVSTDDYLAVRAYLTRRSSFAPQAAERLALDLARRLAAKTAHVPPSQVTPVGFLQVVAARVQERSRQGAPMSPGRATGGLPAPGTAAGWEPPSAVEEPRQERSVETPLPQPEPSVAERERPSGRFAPPS